ncbi:MAG: hypothetical protein L7F77_09425 [Candidatus Magnetominusculus sp. LBB02]|nr:hypothetical protein [Candidatus Magnetominusculus sp. LBB02]
MNTKNKIVKFFKPIAFGLIIIVASIACEDEIFTHLTYYKDKWLETYYNGPGHGNKVELVSYPLRLDNGSIKVEIFLTLDNVTRDAFNIRERFENSEIHSRIYYWLSFNYKTFSTNCKEVSKDMVAYPISISSPSWWPDDLKKSFFPINRSKYKYYRCRAGYAGYELSFFQYFAIDNATKEAYYWHTMLVNTNEKSINKYYYSWEKHK